MEHPLLGALSAAAERLGELIDAWRDEEGEVRRRLVPFSGDRDDIEMLADDLDQLVEEVQDTVRGVRSRKIDSADLRELLEWRDDIDIDLESLTGGAEARAAIDALFSALQAAADGLGTSIVGRRDFYVYAHRTKAGKVFYIGKGTGQRAWSRNRHVLWEKYVDERLGGQYDVEVLQEGLTEREAEERESELIAQYRGELVNWADQPLEIGLSFNPETGELSADGPTNGPGYYEALREYHRIDGEIRAANRAAKALEKTDPDQSIAMYRASVDRLEELAKACPREPGLKGELMGPWRPGGVDLDALDRLTMLLSKAKRYSELVAAVDAVQARFPGLFPCDSVGQRIWSRREKAAGGPVYGRS